MNKKTKNILRWSSVRSTKISIILMASKVTVNWSSLVGLSTHMLFKIITIWGAKALIKGKATLCSLHWNTDSNVCNALSWIWKKKLNIWPQLFKSWIEQLVALILIHWIVIYPMDNAIQLLNNWGLVVVTQWNTNFKRRRVQFVV